jgi:hypothetical protein
VFDMQEWLIKSFPHLGEMGRVRGLKIKIVV